MVIIEINGNFLSMNYHSVHTHSKEPKNWKYLQKNFDHKISEDSQGKVQNVLKTWENY